MKLGIETFEPKPGAVAAADAVGCLDVVLTDSDGNKYSFDNLATRKWLEGHMPGLDMAVAYLKSKAVDIFKEGRDEDATRMRKLAEEMKKELSEQIVARVKNIRREYPYKLNDIE